MVNSEYQILIVEDSQLAANSLPCRIHIEGGKATVTPWQQDSRQMDQRTGALRHVVTDIATFSELYVGVTSAGQARMAGRLEADDIACAALATAFAVAPLYMWQADWF